jgi:murein DD-endopeptidase MepM/ murein hydrolase activator NlpD
MARRLVLVFLLALAVVPVAAGDVGDKKQQVDSKISTLHDRIARAQQKEGELSGQIADVTKQIRTLESQVGVVSSQLAPLEEDLRLHELRLNKLNALYELETRKYEFLRRQYAAALDRLNARIVQVYESNDPGTVDVLLASHDFSDLIDQIDYLQSIADQDKHIAVSVGRAKADVKVSRARAKKLRDGVQAVALTIAARTAQVREARDRLLASQNNLSGARQNKLQDLSKLKASERADAEEAAALSAVSARLAARLQAVGSRTSAGSPSPGGLIWPVNGPVTSPFGWRWGRMHEGIDIGVGYGTPIHAAGSGTVVYAGWESGYGNLTVIDHGGGLATAYGHQSSISVSNGQHVDQGQVIGYVGCTGHCFGPHLHFEVRVNGSPVDPLGYL